MYLKIDDGTGIDKEAASCKSGIVKPTKELQIVGLSSAGGTIIFEQAADGKNFTVCEIGGSAAFTSDDTYHILYGDYFIRANYDGAQQSDIKIILR
ncbi:MAG: hypothetical protein LBV16_02465 [Elusimicrobiota bacterium]|jgi:hypothetical protein|nr:hypothetical protein [Elusimicrobiota bacterium]